MQLIQLGELGIRTLDDQFFDGKYTFPSVDSTEFTAYFYVGDYNVICVDWRQYSTDLSYAGAKLRAKHIAKDIACVLKKITYNMTVGVHDLHLIGHSMGAHITGFVGKILNDPRVPRITGKSTTIPGKGKADELNVEYHVHGCLEIRTCTCDFILFRYR